MPTETRCPHIPFSLKFYQPEHSIYDRNASSTDHGQQIPFLDTMLIIDNNRKSTDTNKYLSFNSHNLIQSKRAVVESLFDRAKNIPTTISYQKSEHERIITDLTLNGYPTKFITQASQPKYFIRFHMYYLRERGIRANKASVIQCSRTNSI